MWDGTLHVRIPLVSERVSWTNEAYEDCDRDTGRCYGHREDPPRAGDEYSDPDQATGSRYEMGDYPGVYVRRIQEMVEDELGVHNPRLAISFRWRFLLNIENTCSGGVVESEIYERSCPQRLFTLR